MIEAVLFDLDGTIFNTFDADYQLKKEIIQKFGYKMPQYPRFVKAHALSRREALALLTAESSESKINEMMKFSEGQRYPVELVKLNEGALESIVALGFDYKLGVASGKSRERVDLLLSYFGLEQYFDVILSRKDYSKPKPNPESLLSAAKALSADPINCVYVGDNEQDAEAARAANMFGVIYTDSRMPTADSTIDSFKDLKREIESLDRKRTVSPASPGSLDLAGTL